MSNSVTPFLQGKGIYFRELQKSDIPKWYQWFNDEVITKYQNKHIFPNSEEGQLDYYHSLHQSSKDVVFAIIASDTHEHIGNVGLHHINWIHRSAELGIVLGDKAYWGKGFGKQAWNLITEYGFQTLNLHRVYAQIMEENIASCKSAEASGYKLAGTIRDMFFRNGKYHHVKYYDVLKEEFISLHQD